MSISLLHLPDTFGAQPFNFMLFHSHLLTVHLLEHFLVALLLSLPLIPFIVANLCNDAIIFFFLLLFLLKQSLLMLSDLLVNAFLA